MKKIIFIILGIFVFFAALFINDYFDTKTTDEFAYASDQQTEEIIIEIVADYYYSIDKDLDFVILGKNNK
ncbi:MAG: hypothetical protein B6U87_02425 [Candidatus Aenigmarchaeota archaeon ex4484_52]|nr:MAG: hypothetical protein B6U87_02425 [Candidatus Aenigmarchaeota archaeon ex4484_52]